MKQRDKKGVGWYLLFTFGITIFVTIILWLNHFLLTGRNQLPAQLGIAGLMFAPGLSAFIVRKFITKEGFKDAGLHWGSWKYYLQIWLLIPIFFVIAYTITGLFLYQPDFGLRNFSAQYGVSLPPNPQVILLIVFLSSITFASVINSLFAFGEEFGWRGYLLPKLLPLGKTRAILISGIIWGLWHAPFILLLGYHYPQQPWLGVVFFMAITTCIGSYLSYIRIKTNSTVAAAFGHGVFNSQFYGVWQLIFPGLNPFFGGMLGLVGILTLLPLAIWAYRKM